jgi:hypothetical protein
MSLFKAIALFIGWLTSSLAGIGAILYACGYLISRAQLGSLGLSGILERPADFYLQEGARFFVVLVAISLGPLIPWLVFGRYVLLFLLILSLPVGVFLIKRAERIDRYLGRARDGVVLRLGNWPRLWRNCAFLGLLFILLFHLTGYLNQFTPALEVRNLLYGSTNLSDRPSTAALVRLIMAGEGEKLEEHFRALLWGTLQTGVVLALAWHVTSRMRLRMWLLAPFVILLMLYVLFLPLAYGTLVRPTSFPVIALTTQNSLAAGVEGRLFLLNKSERELVLWDRRGRRILFIPHDQVQAAEVKEIRPLFEPRGVAPRTSQGGHREQL